MWFFNYVRHCLVTLYALHAKNVIIIQSFITWLFIVIFHILQVFDKGWTAVNIYNMKFNSCQYLKSVWCLQIILSCAYLLNNIQERDSTKISITSSFLHPVIVHWNFIIIILRSTCVMQFFFLSIIAIFQGMSCGNSKGDYTIRIIFSSITGFHIPFSPLLVYFCSGWFNWQLKLHVWN